MTLGRREFLQRLSAAIAALGVSDMALVGAGRAYQRALAEPNRCLAVLVGISSYASTTWQSETSGDKGSLFRGALTDVELQRELLTNRFGVSTRDIVTLVDSEATVNQILETVQGHLVDQAKAGDTVIFHFSGCGSQVQLSGHPDATHLPTLVAADSHLPVDDVPVIQDLFEESLVQAFSALKGVKLMTVIDASETRQPSLLQGNFRVRSRPVTPVGVWQPPFNDQLREPSQSLEALAADWPGLLLRPSLTGTALEGSWDGFSAGLLTYALTQQIWTSLPAQRQQWFLHRVNRKLSAWTGTDKSPQMVGQVAATKPAIPLLSGRLPKPAADAVIKTLDTVNKSAILWLGGLPAGLLPYAELGLAFQPLPTLPGLAAVREGKLTVKALEGLRAKAALSDSKTLPVGTPLVEVERRFPRELTLCIALDPQLERIERVDATSALSGLSFITTSAPGEKLADCLFGRGPQRSQAESSTDSSTESSSDKAQAARPGYGLFTPDGTLLTGTLAEEGEAVKTAVSRLHGSLRSLLAAKMLRLTMNPVSSQLSVRLTLETQEPNQQLLLMEETLRSRQLNGTSATKAKRFTFKRLSASRGEQYQIRLLNSGQVPLYYLLVSIIDKKQLSVYCPPVHTAEGSDQTSRQIAQASELLPGAPLSFPQLEDNTFSLQPMQATEIFALASVQPFTETWKAIRTADFRQQSDRWSTIPTPLVATKAVFRDLNRASAQLTNPKATPPDSVFAFSSAAWTTLSL